MDIFYMTFNLQIIHSSKYFVIANAAEYYTFHIKLKSTIFGKKGNRVPCLYRVGVPCLYRHVEYYSMSDSICKGPVTFVIFSKFPPSPRISTLSYCLFVINILV